MAVHRRRHPGTRQHLPKNMRTGGPDSTSISSQYQAGIGLTTFEIDLFGRLRNLSEAAYQQYLSTEQAQRSVHITLVGAVAESYFNLRAADVQLDLTRKTLQSRQESYNLVKTRFDGGVASELDLNQSKSLLDSASSDLAQLARTRAQALNALVVLLGVPSLPADLPQAAEFGRDQILATVPAGLPSDLLERRPDILAAENQLRAAKANIGAARAAFFPTISLTGLLGVASPSLDTLFRGGQGYWSFSPQITTPLFAGGSIIEGLNLAKRATTSPWRSMNRPSSRLSARSPTRWPARRPTAPSWTRSAACRPRRPARWNCPICAMSTASTAICRCRPPRWISSMPRSPWCRRAWRRSSTASNSTRPWEAAGWKIPPCPRLNPRPRNNND